MARPWRGPLVLEDTQTGDGRVIAEGAVYWADPPLPFAWLREGDQHVSPSEAPQIGTIESLTREGKAIIGEGNIDDENPDGAELARRMDVGEAAGGSRQFVSIDADDWEVEIVTTEPLPDDEEIEITAAVSDIGYRGAWPDRSSVAAAAGDPDPGPGGGDDGESLMEDAADAVIERATRLRIRGVTACAVSAFDGAYIELVDGEAPAEEVTPEPVQAHAAADAPPAEWFADPHLDELQRWVTATDDGRVFGHLAGNGECHIGYPDRCVDIAMLARDDESFPYFHVGHVVTTEGNKVPTGVLAVKGGHANVRADWRSAQAHYDDTDSGVADVHLGQDAHGIWFSGRLRPWAEPQSVDVLRASGVSGDWRNIGGSFRLIGACSVNTPGFPKAQARIVAGAMTALVAAGGRPQSAFAQDDCGCGTDRFDAVERRIARLETEASDRILASFDARVHPH